MLPALLAALLAQAPSPPRAAVVLVSRQTGVSPERSAMLAMAISHTLADAGIKVAYNPEEALAKLSAEGHGDPQECRGRDVCLIRLGAALGAYVLVSVDIGEVLPDLALRLRVLATDDGLELDEESLVLPAKDTAQLASAVRPLAARLKEAWGTAPASDVPPALLSPKAAPPALPVPGSSSWERHAAFATSGGAAAAAAAAVAFALAGSSQRARLEVTYPVGAEQASPLSYSQASSLASDANRSFTLAAVCAGASALLAGGAVYLWHRSGVSR
ncbi:MAG: hypothetical protein HYZ28_19695 [Myxococcales bacterium]|nr:hypothetical protein [Myxococcales bacterium]